MRLPFAARARFTGCSDHYIGEHIGIITLGHIILNASARNVVGRGKLLVCRCVVHDNAVAVGKAGVEAQRFAAEMLLKAGDKLSGLLGGDFVRAVILHYFLLVGAVPRKGDKVCAQGDIVLLHFYAQRCGLQRGAPGKV